MQLGPFVLPTPYWLAPMASASEAPFRQIAMQMGASLAPTELLSAEGLARRSAPTLRLLRHDPALERPFCVQLFGSNPLRMAVAAKIAQDHGAQIVDLNMGCPVPKITRSGAGAALMRDPARAAAIVSAMARATGLPITVKIRSGWDSSTVNAPEVARALEEAGACAIAVHARTRAQGYGGAADWSVIARVRQAVKTAVIGNGDVADRAGAERMRSQTGCDAVMIGRAALGNPWIFRELLGGPPPTSEERRATVLRHLEAHLALYSSQQAGLHSFRQTLIWYARGLRGAGQFRSLITGLEELEKIREEIERFLSVENSGALSSREAS
jgi:nifR3 family TIM-barrel protein